MPLALTELATEIIDQAGYVGLVALMALENVVPPIPSEVVLPLAGFLVEQGALVFFGALLAATLGSVLGAVVLHTGARAGGRPLVHRLPIAPRTLDRAEAWFDRHGALVVVLGRLVPGVRSLVSVPAGLARMPLWRFCGLTAIGSLAWNTLLITAGLALGASWHHVGSVVGPASKVVLVLAVAGAVVLLTRHVRRRRPGAARAR